MSTQIERFQAEYSRQYGGRIEFPLTHPCKEWAWFQLGESSGMERAAKVCEAEKLVDDTGERDDDAYNYAIDECVRGIRALLALGGE